MKHRKSILPKQYLEIHTCYTFELVQAVHCNLKIKDTLPSNVAMYN